MGAIRDLAERAWSGQAVETFVHPLVFHGLEELARGLSFAVAFSNLTVVETAEGLVLVDASGPLHGGSVMAALRRRSAAPIRLVILTHGHVDHVTGLAAIDEDARAAGHSRPEVIAHRALQARLERYALTHGHNALLNQRQFQLPAPIFPLPGRGPDRTFDGDLVTHRRRAARAPP